MADAEANLRIGIDANDALATIRNLQRQISVFHSSLQQSGNAANAAFSQNMQRNLVASVNATRNFSASLTNIKSTAESFSQSLEANKLSMGEYFKFAGGATKSFGKVFKNEFNIIEKTARERVKTLQTQYIKMGRDANGALQAIKVRPLTLDMNSLGTQVAMTAQKQQIFNQLLKQGSTNLLNFGKNTQWAGRQLMVGFTIPLTIMGGVAIKEFQKIEEQVVKFRRVYGGMFNTSGETEAALKNVRELANEFTKYGIAVEKTIDLAAKVAQMGNVGKALEEQVTQATRLSVLGGMEQMDALDTTISLTNAFGVEIEDLANKINFLNAAENQTILAINDFNTAIPLAGSVVKQLGGSVEDLAFFLTAMREGGINASQAGNALKSSLGRLIAPSRNAKETLSGFGIDVLGIVEANANNLMGTVMALGQELDRLDPLSRSRAIEALFGKFQFARMSTLFQNITREGSQANKVLQLTVASSQELAIIANRELRAVEESPAFKLQKQMEELKAALAPIGAEFVKLITPILKFGTEMLKKFNGLDEGVKNFVTGAVAVLGGLAPVALMVFGLFANGVANLIKGLNFVRLLFGRLSGATSGVTGQLQYMTMEQLQGAAASASLGHQHSALTQIFSSEAQAINRLVGAYAAATAAQRTFNQVPVVPRVAAAAPTITRAATGRRASSPGGAIPGFAQGVLSVPGPKGAGDVVPAMLSPGEAVIPVKQNEKYGGLIRGIIADNIPGYEYGTLQIGSRFGELPAVEEKRAQGLRSKIISTQPRGRRRTASRSASIISSNIGEGAGEQAIDGLASQGVAAGTSVKIMSRLAGEAEKGTEAFERAIDSLFGLLQSIERKANNAVKSANDLLADFDESIDYDPQNQGVPVTHLGGGAEYTVGELRGMAEAGEIKPLGKEFDELEEDKKIGVKTALGIKHEAFDQRLNNQMQSAGYGGAEIQDVREAFAADTDNTKWDRSLELVGNTAEEIDTLRPQIQMLDAEFERLLASVKEGTRVFDSAAEAQKYVAENPGATAVSTEEVLGTARGNLRQRGEAPQLLDQLDTAQVTPVEYRIDGQSPGDEKRSSKIAKGAEPPERLVAQAQKEQAITSINPEALVPVQGAAEQAVDTFAKTVASSENIEQMNQGGRALASGTVEGIKDEGEINSPSKKTWRLGQGMVQGFVSGVQDAIKGGPAVDPSAAANRPRPPLPPGIAESMTPAVDARSADELANEKGNSIGFRIGQRFVEAAERGAEKVLDATPIGRTLKEGLVASAAADAAEQGGSYEIVDKEGNTLASSDADARRQLEEQRAKNNADEQQINEQRQVFLDENGEQIELSQLSVEEQQRLAKEQQKTNSETKKLAAAQRRQSVAGKAFGVLGTVSMVAGIASTQEGAVGDIARQILPVAGALTGILPILLALPGPLALLAAGIGVVVGGIFLWNKMINDSRKAGMALANALTTTAEEIIAISEVTGMVSATEKARQARQDRLAGTDEAQRKFGQTFLESDPGKAILSDINLLSDENLVGVGASAAGAIARRLALAVAQNAMSPEQANSIVSSLGMKLNDHVFSANVSLQLSALIGQNGEDLTKDH
jgi:TP901 family phage tail tape measure protein